MYVLWNAYFTTSSLWSESTRRSDASAEAEACCECSRMMVRSSLKQRWLEPWSIFGLMQNACMSGAMRNEMTSLPVAVPGLETAIVA